MAITVRKVTVVFALFLLASCTSVGRIQQTEPVRTAKFTGSNRSVAQCIQQRVGGKVQDEGFGQRYIVYDSVKNLESLGLTHYAFTIARTGPDQGVVEWRVMSPQLGTDPQSERLRSYANPGATPLPPGTLADAAVRRFWDPAQDCAARAKSLSQ
jgi:hypothetical protein